MRAAARARAGITVRFKEQVLSSMTVIPWDYSVIVKALLSDSGDACLNVRTPSPSPRMERGNGSVGLWFTYYALY